MGKVPSHVASNHSAHDSLCRVYVHTKCGQSTVVDGREFVVLSDPFAFVEKTLCSHCGTPVDLEDVVWTDTNESIRFSREQTRSKLSLPARAWAYAIGPILGALIGSVAGACWPPHKVPEIVTGLIGGAIIGWLVLQIPARQYLGMDFRRKT